MVHYVDVAYVPRGALRRDLLAAVALHLLILTLVLRHSMPGLWPFVELAPACYLEGGIYSSSLSAEALSRVCSPAQWVLSVVATG